MEIVKELYLVWRSSKKRKDRDRLLVAIWNTYHPKLQVFLSSFPEEDREDRVSEILLYAFESLKSYNPDFAFSTWIYRVARNRHIDLLRRDKIIPLQWDDDFEWGHEETPEVVYLKEEEREMIEKAIQSLKSRDREILFLAYYEEMKYAEIATILEIPLGTIKYRIHEIKKRLKTDLKEDLSYGRK